MKKKQGLQLSESALNQENSFNFILLSPPQKINRPKKQKNNKPLHQFRSRERGLNQYYGTLIGDLGGELC